MNAGDQHAAVISEANELYTFGSGSYYKLGHGQAYSTLDYWSICIQYKGVDKDEIKPKKIVQLEDVYVTDVSCGVSHTLCLTNEGFIYSFGSGLSG